MSAPLNEVRPDRDPVPVDNAGMTARHFETVPAHENVDPMARP